jgi:N-acetylmuramic acid 6-phosphate etherase
MTEENKLHATERLNETAKNVHAQSVMENLRMINAQNARVADTVEKALPAIERVVTEAIARIKNGGRVCYLGAGTSGRLGVLDASECPPTYSVAPDLIHGIIAGGDSALREAGEGAEDDPEAGLFDIAHLNEKDVLIGVSASGSSVYVRAAVHAARKRGVFTAAICTASDAPLLKDAECPILAPTEPEIPAGSTRMFSGTAQKMILNMISTGIMIGLGKVYAGYMIDVRTSNIKLWQRAVHMIATLSGCTIARAEQITNRIEDRTENPVKAAIVMILENVDYDRALEILQANDSRIDDLMRKHGRNVALGCS